MKLSLCWYPTNSYTKTLISMWDWKMWKSDIRSRYLKFEKNKIKISLSNGLKKVDICQKSDICPTLVQTNVGRFSLGPSISLTDSDSDNPLISHLVKISLRTVLAILTRLWRIGKMRIELILWKTRIRFSRQKLENFRISLG